MNIHQVLENIPQRYPFIMIDKVLELTPDKKIIAIKNVSVNEPFFMGHFPGYPVMPGVLILEALAQTSIILAKSCAAYKGTEQLHLFAGIEKARFKRIVTPGDQLHLHVTILKERKGIWKTSGVATVDNEEVCTALLTSASKDM